MFAIISYGGLHFESSDTEYFIEIENLKLSLRFKGTRAVEGRWDPGRV